MRCILALEASSMLSQTFNCWMLDCYNGTGECPAMGTSFVENGVSFPVCVVIGSFPQAMYTRWLHMIMHTNLSRWDVSNRIDGREKQNRTKTEPCYLDPIVESIKQIKISWPWHTASYTDFASLTTGIRRRSFC